MTVPGSDTSTVPSGPAFFRRIRILLCLFCLWGAVAAVRLVWFSIVRKETLVRETTRLAWREGGIPVARGRLLSSDGVPLAWTVLHHDMILSRRPARKKRADHLLAELRETFGPDIVFASSFPQTLLRSVSPDRMARMENLLSRYPELSFRLRVERKRVEYPRIRTLLGECSAGSDGDLRGISGFERDRDLELRGEPGIFRVMLDRIGDWVPDTLKIVRPPVSGRDVVLDRTFEELRGNEN